MALSINTNVASLNAQRNLSRSQETLNTSLQRLSTGLRINSAKDDAAGLAISTRFTTQINGLNQAVRNANDGISLAQTGEAALDEITNNLQRIRELAVQSANSTYSASDRAALDAEVQQRLAEIDRIGGQTSFNGTKILDGSFGTATFQVGANVGETISVNLNSGVKSSQIGQVASQTNTVTAGALVSGGLTLAVGDAAAVTVGASAAGSKGIDATLTEGGQAASSAYAKAEAINAAGISGLSALASTEATIAFTDVTSAGGAGTYSLKINDTDIYDTAVVGSTLDIGTVAAAINAKSAELGVTAEVSGSDIVLTAEDGRTIQIDETLAGDTAGGVSDSTNYGEITLSASEAITVGGTAPGTTGFSAGTVALGSDTLASASVGDVDSANDAIQRVDAALTSVSNLRSDFGAVQNRFESTITNLQTISENLSASRGRILDADFAAETANLTKAQILQQAGTAILAQANSLPQSVLSLLQ
ncbi:flagellin/flagellar hook associated protein [Spongiibacter sp. IMCC21906]|uniref:flagellin n=1 Tax=Spongiibacter sp. IMCC21906 TaxID=1620392 RepID=UPI00062DD932|nr:flagellin [Spongiibacter sp. IMCC21906]AKH69439.1 flagellin/flagellar hook associated protein [Spongiibacter sp. IMCC21906]